MSLCQRSKVGGVSTNNLSSLSPKKRRRAPNSNPVQKGRILKLEVNDDEVNFGFVRSVLEDISVLVLNNNNITDDSLAQLDLNKAVVCLDTLVLENQNITDVGLELLATALLQNRSRVRLRQLVLRNNPGITSYGVVPLGVWANRHPGEFNVRFNGPVNLSLSRNMIGLDLNAIDMSFLSAMIKTDTTLCVLRLNQNSLGNNGTICLARALQKNTTLLELDLRSNNISTLGWKAMYCCLVKNVTLRHVDMRHNKAIKLSHRFGKEIKKRAGQVWPALSQLVLLLDDGIWEKTTWTFSYNRGLRSKIGKNNTRPWGEIVNVYTNGKDINSIRKWVNHKVKRTKPRTDYLKWKREYDDITDLKRQHTSHLTLVLSEMTTKREERAAVRIQSIVRARIADKRVITIRKIKEISFTEEADRAARRIQRVLRAKALYRERSIIKLQKSIRGFDIKRKLLPLNWKLCRDSNVLAASQNQEDTVFVMACGVESARGRYICEGAGHDEQTSKYIKNTGQVLERVNGVWMIYEIQDDCNTPGLLYVNEFYPDGLTPPSTGWILGPTAKIIASSSSRPVVSTLSQKTVRINGAGTHEVNGVYVCAGLSESELAFEKHDCKHSITYAIRKVKYLNENRLWVVFESRENDPESYRVLYCSHHEGEDASSLSDASWERVQGEFPIPFIEFQENIFDLEGKSGPSGSDSRRRKTAVQSNRKKNDIHIAATVIQVFFRGCRMRSVAELPSTLKDLSRIVALEIDLAGKPEANGIYTCIGTTGSGCTLCYIKEDGGEEIFMVERIREGTMWAILYIADEASAADILYYNRASGTSLYPPKTGWKASNSIHEPVPSVQWVEAVREEHDRTKRSVVLTDSGTAAVHGRYEERGHSDGVEAYTLTRDRSVHIRRITHGQSKLWINVKITPPDESNIIYYFNVECGNFDSPPLEGWVPHQGQEPMPLIVEQQIIHSV